MARPMGEVSCARIPREALAALAEIRCLPGVTAAAEGKHAWVHWEPGDEQVLRCLLPVSGVRLFVRREGRWYQFARHLPAFNFPEGLDWRPLAHLLLPAAVQAVPPPEHKLAPVELSLVPDPRPRPTTAVTCALAELALWADTVPSPRLAAIQAVRRQDQVFLRGSRLPLLPRDERFWGERVLVPLGFRTEPALSESALREALDLGEKELMLISPEGAEVIDEGLFRPLTRAGLRLALVE